MHRDLKPANCLVQDDGAGLLVQAKLADLGCSKRIVEGDPNPNNPHTFVGTDGFRAPEVTGQQYDQSADYWSAGATIICCAVGNPRGLLPSGIGVGDGPGVPQFQNMYPEATIVVKLVSSNPKERPIAKDILKDDWVKDRVGPNEDAASAEELEKAQGRAIKLARDLASAQADTEEAVRQKEEAEDEIARLKAVLAALQAKAVHDARDGSDTCKDFEGAGPDDNATCSATGNEVRMCYFLMICNMCYFSSMSISPSLCP